MLEFYEFNTLNICIVLISTFIIYYILSNYLSFNDSKKETENDNKFNLEYLIISILLGVLISLGFAYFMTGQEETILTDNYWDPIETIDTVKVT